LAGISYWGPVGGHGLVNHDLEMIRAEQQKRHPSNQGLVAGEVEALPGDDTAEYYVVVKHKDHSEGKQDQRKCLRLGISSRFR